MKYSPEDTRKLLIWEQFIRSGCGWSIPFENVVLISRAPAFIRWNTEDLPVLHGDGVPSVEFADGYKVWSCHGTWLENERYHVHSTHWKPEWLLDETNAEMRRRIIQMVGYEAIVQDLGAETLDQWREYSLLQIKQEVDVEPIHLLKMTCPSTKDGYIIRVPPTETTARGAAAWINHDVDPALFAVET